MDIHLLKRSAKSLGCKKVLDSKDSPCSIPIHFKYTVSYIVGC